MDHDKAGVRGSALHDDLAPDPARDPARDPAPEQVRNMSGEAGADLAALAASVSRRLTQPIVLVGMMGVGKTSLGRKLAAALGLPFVDADEAIAEAAQRSIPEIFAVHGEAYFRDGERRVLARLLGGAADEAQRGVIATGGGAFCQAQTRALILQRAVAVWLDADLDVLVERTARRDHRPLLAAGDPREILARLRAVRAGDYAQAPIHVHSGAGPHRHTLLQVMRAIDLFLPTAAQ